MNSNIKTILIGGMPQAGSTLCFNLVRELLEQNGYNVLVSLAGRTDENTYFTENKKIDFVLIKQHDGSKADIVINVRRDLRESVASNIRKDPKFLNSDVLKIAKRNFSWYEICSVNADYEWSYEDYKNNPKKITNELSLIILGKKQDHVRVEKIVNEAENIKSKNLSEDLDWNSQMWNKTLMCKKHVTSNNGKIGGYKKTLSEEQIALLNFYYGDWLKEKGYLDE